MYGQWTPRASSNHYGDPSPPVSKGRSSLSALDERREDAIRRGVITYMTSNPRSSGRLRRFSNYNPRSQSTPNLARPQHQRHNSASASATVPRGYDEELLKPPPRYFRPVPTSTSPGQNQAMISAASVASTYGGYGSYQPSHHTPRTSYPPARDAREFTEPQSMHDFITRTERANARAHEQHHASHGSYATPRSSRDSIAAHEGLPDVPVRPGLYNRPKRLSNMSNTSTTSSTTTSMTSRESLESRMRSSSWSSQTSFESYYSAQSSPLQSQRNPWDLPWHRPAPIKQRRKARPGELFAALPGEVLELILEELKKLHLKPGSTSCATCWMRDACSVALGARKMLKYARVVLYEDIQLIGADSPQQKKKHKPLFGTRISLLRRTLRSSPQLAAIVRSIKVPAVVQGVNAVEYYDLVSTLLMACPNLERVYGFYPGYDHSFGRYVHSLSTRQRLKEMNWIVEPSPYQRQARLHAVPGNHRHPETHLLAPGDLQPSQSSSFLEFHVNWQYLTTLAIHCKPGATLTPDTLLTDCMMYLRSLQNLHLSHLPYTSFNDTSLLSLPPLKKLSLVHLSGISSAGLSAFATRGTSRSLQKLTLVHIDVDSLAALARIFSNLSSLATFSLVQSYPPVLPEDEVIWLYPYLASASLRFLHWDVPTHPARANTADVILSRSIAANGFPTLCRLRAPADPEGLFQSLCKPREKVALPGDQYRGGVRHHSYGSTGHAHSTSSLTGGKMYRDSYASKSPTSPTFPRDAEAPRTHSNLHQARLAAQARVEAAQRLPRYFVNIIDEDGVLREKYGIAGFMGSVESKIAYHLCPDPGGVDEKGGLVDVEDVLTDRGEDLLGKESKEWKAKGDSEAVRVRDGCTGRWNAESAFGDRKDKERWSHTERGRWTGVALS